MDNNRKPGAEIISVSAMAVIIIVILLLVVFAASSYRFATVVQQGNNNERALLSYVTSCISEDSVSEISVKKLGDADGLVIHTEGAGYEHRIYLKDGRLLEEYAEKGVAVSPEDALVIGETEVFRVSFLENGLVRIETDCGTAYAAGTADNRGRR